MKIILKGDWDSIPSGLHRHSPYFSGREKELGLLKHLILHKPSGLILVGASRGVGKTDLVYKALAESTKEEKGLIPIVINATQLLINPVDSLTNEDLLKRFLINLITRTYSVCQNKKLELKEELLERIELLYYQATAKTYEEQLSSSKKSENIAVRASDSEHSRIWKFSFNKSELIKAIKIVYVPIALSIPLINPEFATRYFYLLASAIYVLLIVGDFNIDLGEKIEKRDSKKTSKEISDLANILYLRDNSFGNLEFGLKEFLKDLQEKGNKPVFVIDEFDKVNIASKEPEAVLNMICLFKGLFNHADALFLVIADHKVFDKAFRARSLRGADEVYSTLFNQLIYINRPNAGDLKEYVAKIIVSPKRDISEDFINHMMYASRMDFYRIADVIRDHIQSFDGDKPILEWGDDNQAKQQSNKQRVISSLLEKYLYKQQSRLFKNERLIDSAYEVADSKLKLEFPEEVVLDIEHPDETLIAQLKSDVARFLSLVNIFQHIKTTKDGNNFYQYTPIASVGQAINNLNDNLEFEKEYLLAFKEFESFILNVYNLWAGLTKKAKVRTIDQTVLSRASDLTGLVIQLYNKSVEVKTELISHPEKHKRSQEEIKILIDELRRHQLDILNNNTLNCLQRIFNDIPLESFELMTKKESLDSYPNLRDHLVNNTISTLVIRPDEKKLVLVILNPSFSVVTNDKVKDEINTSKRIRALELYETTTHELPKINERYIQAKSINGYYLTSSELKTLISSSVSRAGKKGSSRNKKRT